VIDGDAHIRQTEETTMTTNRKPTPKDEETKGQAELSEEQLKDVSGGPIYMTNTNTLLPAVQGNPTAQIGTFTGGVKGG
jgi:hypothetical protein